MRNNGIFVILTLAFIITISAIGDEDASPSPSIDLAVEPITVAVEPNISRAALRNDFLMFDTLYKTADARSENVARWSELHRFWMWSMTDPVGGFYGQETHDRFARAHPGYAKFIEDYRIIDANGNAFYPSAETRRFLLANVGEQPVRQIARAVLPAPEPAPAPEPVKVPVKAAPVRQSGQARASVLHSEPLVVASVPAPAPAPVRVAAAPAPITQPVLPEPAHPGVGRGIFLIIVGLIGIGVVTIMLHAPGEEPRNPHPGIT